MKGAKLSNIQKVLIIRFSSIGDIVLTTPVIRCIKQQMACDVHFLTKRIYKQILIGNPHIDKIHTLDGKMAVLLSTLRRERYDLIVDLHKNLRSLRIRWSLGARSLTFNKINWHKWLLVNLKIDLLPRVHIVDRNLSAVAGLGIVNDLRGLDYFIPPEDEVDANDLVTHHVVLPPSILPKKEVRHNGYLAFVIGAAHNTKRLPNKKIISLCRKIEMPIVLLGGPGEEAVGDAIVRASGGHVLNMCGKLRLNQSASLVRQATVVITHDTGLMHIAAAFRKPIISIWGNTVPEFGMYPYYPARKGKHKTIEVSGLSCRPCSKIGYAQCPKGHFKCMWDIDEETICKHVRLLAY